ncbi:MAG: hypothetical protein QXD77_00535 [Candidatus Aenigmatarchaeota archaeon]
MFHLKGEAGEELFASFFVIALVFVFTFSAIGVYGNFMEGQAQLYAERSASSVAEKLFFDNNGYLTLSDCSNLNRTYNAMNNTAIAIIYWEGGLEKRCASGSLDVRSLSVSSMPVTVVDDGKYYPGRIDAMVGV